MGIMKILNSAADFLIKIGEKRKAEIEHYRQVNERYDDERLIGKYERTSGLEKVVIKLILSERGVSVE